MEKKNVPLKMDVLVILLSMALQPLHHEVWRHEVCHHLPSGLRLARKHTRLQRVAVTSKVVLRQTYSKCATFGILTFGNLRGNDQPSLGANNWLCLTRFLFQGHKHVCSE